MNKNTYWAPVGNTSGKVWVDCWLFKTKQGLEEALDRSIPDGRINKDIQIRQVQIVVLPQKKRGKRV